MKNREGLTISVYDGLLHLLVAHFETLGCLQFLFFNNDFEGQIFAFFEFSGI